MRLIVLFNWSLSDSAQPWSLLEAFIGIGVEFHLLPKSLRDRSTGPKFPSHVPTGKRTCFSVIWQEAPVKFRDGTGPMEMSRVGLEAKSSCGPHTCRYVRLVVIKEEIDRQNTYCNVIV